MGYSDDYFELKRKRKKEEEENRGVRTYSSYSNDIAPVKQTTATSQQSDGWFQKGAYADENKDNKFLKTAGGTVADVTEDSIKGTGNFLERLWDGMLMLGAAMNQGTMTEAANNEIMYNALTGKEEPATSTLQRYQEYQDQVEAETLEYVGKNVIDEEAIAKAIVTDNVAKIGIDVEEDSILGQKSDAIVQSGTDVLIRQGISKIPVVGQALGYAITGLTVMGGEAENAAREGASYEDAFLSGVMSAGAEIGSEAMFGGIKIGNKAWFDKVVGKVVSKIPSKFLATLTKWGFNTAGEGVEEVISGWLSAAGQKVTYKNEEELSELYTSGDAWDDFVSGAVLGGLFEGVNVGVAKKNNIDYITGLTTSEKKVIDKVYNEAVEEAEKKGKHLSSSEKTKIFDKIVADAEKGYISTDTIEEVLGGDDYKAYKKANDFTNALSNRANELGSKTQPTLAEQYEFSNLVKRIAESKAKTSEARAKLDETLSPLLKNSRLAESYNQQAKRKEAFKADLSQYDEKYQATIKKAVESGILNDTRRTHDFVDLIAKISADKGVNFEFTNNERLKNSSFAVEGKVVNGYVDKATNTIGLNIESKKALEKTVGHEITHVLEGTKLYEEFQKVAFEYAKSKKATNSEFANEYLERLHNTIELYKNVDGYQGADAFAKMKQELTADLVGDYIFTDEAFVRNLSTKNRNVFEKIYDEIKYLCKVATAGSEEARRLEKVKKTFEKVYRESGSIKVKETESTGEVKHSVSADTQKTDADYIKAVESGDTETVQKMVDKAAKDAGYTEKVYHGTTEFGYTKFEGTEGHSYDEIQYFATDSIETARTYASTDEVRRVSEKSNDFENYADDMAAFMSNEIGNDNYIDSQTLIDAAKEEDYRTITKICDKWMHDVYETKYSNEYKNRFKKKYKDYYDFADSVGETLQTKINNYRRKLKNLAATETSGIYEFVANTDNLFILDGKGAKWNNIEDSRLPENRPYKTRDVCLWAKEQGYSGVLFKNIIDSGITGVTLSPANVYAFFNPREQVKSADPVTYDENGNIIPLSQRFTPENEDIRYSVSEDSNGNELSSAVQKRFANSKAVDENGNLKVLYHGTASGEFYTFDKSKGSVEGDFGSGFYFTDNETDVKRNYEGGGPDFENKIDRRAEQIESEEGIDYIKARKKAINELYKGSNKFEVYLNIENPAIVGETTLFDYESYAEEYDRDDYDSDEDYEGDVEQLIYDDIDQIIWDVNNKVDVYNTDGLAEVLWNAVNEGGIGIEELKAKINDLYLEDSNGNLVGNEVTRQIIESLGFDGIIDPTVSGKWNMDMEEGTTHYIVFKPNQIKSIDNQNPTDNPDIRFSLGAEPIINKLTEKEISEQAYATLGKLQRGESVALEELKSLPEVMEGAEKVEEFSNKFLSEHPELQDVSKDKIGTHLINSAERERLRDNILQERLKSGSFTHLDKSGNEVYNGSVEKGKRLDIVIGLPAAGKSKSIVLPLSQYFKSVVVDSDIIKQQIPEFNEGWGASLVHEESSAINMRLLGEELALGNNIVLPVVGGKTSSVENYIELAKANYYEVHLHLNELNSSKAMGRMLRRYFSDGRFIPPEVSYKYGDKPTTVYEEMKNRSDISGYSHWNNDVAKGQRPTLTDISKSNGALVEYSRTWRAVREQDAQGNDSESATEAFANSANGVDIAQGLVGMDAPTRENPEGSVRLSQVVRLSLSPVKLNSKTQESLSKSGVVSLELVDSSDDSSAFSNALKEARESDEKNGWAVTPKTAEELVKNNIRTIMTSDGKAGLGVAPDGDIEAVFKNQNGGQQGVLNTLIPAALEMGGNKLDCYGEGLVNLYSRYGFVPVARVDFNKVYANEGWTPDKGTPYIFFMVHNGDSADTVAGNIGKYKKWTTEELNVLPLYDKESYDDAYAYRDGLLPKDIAPIQNSLSTEGETSKEYGIFNQYAENIIKQPNLTYGEDVKLDIAPIREDVAKNVTTTKNAAVEDAPMGEETPKSVRIADGTRSDELLNESLDNYPMQTIEQKVAEKIRAVEGEIADNKDLRREAETNYNSQIEKLREKYASKKDKNTKVANNLLQSISRLERLKASVDADFAKRISDLETRAEKMKDPKYSRAKFKQAKMQEHAKWAENLLGDTSTWKDKKLGLQYATNTEHRNLRDIVRDADGNRDAAKADAINDALSGQYNREQAEKNRELTKIRQKYADLKITNAESEYIQMLGEFRHNPETTLTEKVVNEYYEKHKNKIDKDKVDKVIDLARQDYDSAIERVNEKLREQGMKEIPYRKGYWPHRTDPKQNFIQKLFNWKVQNNDIPTSIAGLTEDFKPVKSWQSFDKTRHSDTTDYNFLKGFDTYMDGALDWIYHLDTLQKRRAVENYIRYTHSDEGIQARIKEVYANEELDADEAQAQIEHILAEAKNPLNNFVQDFMTHTNILAGKKNSLDRTVEQATNRNIYSVMTNVQNRVSANMVLANVRSALTNFIPITQSWAQVSPLRSLQATKDTIANAIKDDGLINKSTFLTNRLREADNLYKTNWDKVLDTAGIMFEVVDNFSSQVIWRSKYNQNLARGMSEAEAIANADQFAENVMAGRSKGNEPTLFNAKNPLVKAFTMFQLEVNNQYGYLFKDAPTDLKAETNHWKLNLAKGYTTAFIGAYVYNALLSELTGSGAALDPIGIIEDLLRDLGLFDDDEEKEPSEVLTNLVENVGGELPFVNTIFGGGRIPISSAVPYSGEGLVQGIGSFAEDIGEGDWQNIGAEMMNPVLNVGLPVGGNQLKKTVQGLKMFSDDHPVVGSYTNSGDLRFPVDNTLGNKIKAGVFGQWANENAQNYIENNRKPLNSEQIEEYMDVELPIGDYWKYRDGLKGLKKNSEKADYINSLDIMDWQKNVLMNNILDRKEDVDMSNYDDYNNWEEFDYASKNPEKYAFAKSVGGYSSYTTYSDALNDIKADKDASGKSITGSRKAKVLDYINNLDATYEAKIILWKSEYPSDDTYNVEIINYINSRNDLTYEEKISIYTELGFTVSNGYVSWN